MASSESQLVLYLRTFIDVDVSSSGLLMPIFCLVPFVLSKSRILPASLSLTPGTCVTCPLFLLVIVCAYLNVSILFLTQFVTVFILCVSMPV